LLEKWATRASSTEMQCSIRLSLCRNHRSIKEKGKSPPPHLERRQYLTAGLFRQTYHSTPVINGRDLFRDGRANQVSATNLECLGPCGISMWRSVAQSMAVQWRPIKNHSTTECQTPCQVIVSLRSLESLRATLHYEANLAIRFRHHVQSWTLYQDAYRVGLIAHPFAINSSFLIMWPEVWWCVSEALP